MYTAAAVAAATAVAAAAAAATATAAERPGENFHTVIHYRLVGTPASQPYLIRRMTPDLGA